MDISTTDKVMFLFKYFDVSKLYPAKETRQFGPFALVPIFGGLYAVHDGATPQEEVKMYQRMRRLPLLEPNRPKLSVINLEQFLMLLITNGEHFWVADTMAKAINYREFIYQIPFGRFLGIEPILNAIAFNALLNKARRIDDGDL